jgi:phosphatidylglycerophosphatase A
VPAFWRQPRWTRFLPDRWVIAFATLGPLGRLPAPGTWGALAGVGWVVLVTQPLGWLWSMPVTLAGLYLALALCGEAEKRLAKIDPPEVNLDEFVVMPLVFLGLHDVLAGGAAWLVYLCGFGLFRLFDIVKPFGIRRLQRFVGGLGVLLDDVAAALVACGGLHVIVWFTPWLDRWRGGM